MANERGGKLVRAGEHRKEWPSTWAWSGKQQRAANRGQASGPGGPSLLNLAAGAAYQPQGLPGPKWFERQLPVDWYEADGPGKAMPRQAMEAGLLAGSMNEALVERRAENACWQAVLETMGNENNV